MADGKENKPENAHLDDEFTFDPDEIGRRLVTPLDDMGISEADFKKTHAPRKTKKRKISLTPEEIRHRIEHAKLEIQQKQENND